MIIPHYVTSIREGIKLAEVDVNFLLLSEHNLYGDCPFEEGRRVFQDVYGKPIPPAFPQRFLNIKTRIDDGDKDQLNLPHEFNPIVVFTKGRTEKYFQNLCRHDLLGEEFLEYLRRLSPKEFGKILTIFAFHEASHRKYREENHPEIIKKYGLNDAYKGSTTLNELLVAIDELKLMSRRNDLEPYIKAIWNGNLDPPYVKAHELAKKLMRF